MRRGDNWRVTVAAVLTLFIAPPLAVAAFHRGSLWGGLGYWAAWLGCCVYLGWPLVLRLMGDGSGRQED